MIDAEAEKANRGFMLSQSLAREAPLVVAVVLVGVILGGLLVGYEPVGGDPDRLYRPLKSELARALAAGRLPVLERAVRAGRPARRREPRRRVLSAEPLCSTASSTSRPPTGSRCGFITWRWSRRRTSTPDASASSAGAARWPLWRSHSAGSRRSIRATSRSIALMPYLPLALCVAERFMASGRHGLARTLAALSGPAMDPGPFSDPDVDRRAGRS